jgi:hypothetical protein
VLTTQGGDQGARVIVVNSRDLGTLWDSGCAVGTGNCCYGVLADAEEFGEDVFADGASGL